MTTDEQNAAAAVAALVKRYHGAVDRVAARLREAADDVERRGHTVHKDLGDLLDDHMDSAKSVLTTVTGMMPNLNLDGLMDAATDVDRAVRRG